LSEDIKYYKALTRARQTLDTDTEDGMSETGITASVECNI